MDPRLIEAAQMGDIDVLYKLLGENQSVLENVDQIPFIDTPLHVAVAAGETLFAVEIATLKPSFTRKLNHAGLSPMHLAVANGHKKTVKGLLAIDSTLVCVKGRERRTPLHDVVIRGSLDLLEEFLSACPQSIEELTNRCETALHLAVKYKQLEASEMLVEWIKLHSKEELLNWKDDEGNTVLHLAAIAEQHKLVMLLTKKNAEGVTKEKKKRFAKGVDIGAKNDSGKTALDILNQSGKSDEEILPRTRTIMWNIICSYTESDSLKYFRFQKGKDSPNDVRNALLVVAVLMATATYQAGLSPPGGVSQNKEDAGEVIMDTENFLLFAFFNSAGFYTSLAMMFILTVGFPMRELLIFSLISLLITYISSIVNISPAEVSDGYVILLLLGLPILYIIATVSTLKSTRHMFQRLSKNLHGRSADKEPSGGKKEDHGQSTTTPDIEKN